ncbi:MAG: alpha/beta hydrolase-fold protein [Verrucomicrobiales bacterium]|nr:alpha/beta hydrolase-fold protein [Verrucomicrobiales bacterium]
MKAQLSFLLSFALFSSLPAKDEDYAPGTDAMPKEGVPRGAVTKHSWESEIFPGTVRDYWVYVPSQYKEGNPASLLICQDGGGFVRENGAFRAPTVLDNLIHAGDIPVTIGIFVNPGVVPAVKEGQQPRKNRSFEYDTLSDQYARFLLEEILPEVGKSYQITNDPANRVICGNSSGGICAFTAAWERPAAFGNVISHIGSFTNIRGGHVYPALIRKSEPKPIRVFLQDGENDLDNLHGNWPIANEQMAAALEYAGYDYQFVMGTGKHSGRHGGAIFPDTLRWIWRDWNAADPEN